MGRDYKVIINTSPKNRPRDYELSAALLLAEHFKSDVIFLRPISMKSPDLLINGRIWELKSPTGNSKNTISNNFKTARKQSLNIIIDLRRCKLHEQNAIAKITYSIAKRRRKMGDILVITKHRKILDFSERNSYNNSNRR